MSSGIALQVRIWAEYCLIQQHQLIYFLTGSLITADGRDSFTKKTNSDTSSFTTNGHFREDLNFSLSGRYSMILTVKLTLFATFALLRNSMKIIGNRLKTSFLIDLKKKE